MKKNKNKFTFFSESQKEQAINTDLSKFLPLHGYELVRSGSEYKLKSDKSISIDGNRWYDHSRESGGNPISLIKELFNCDWKGAMELLTGETGQEMGVTVSQKEKKKPFILPEKYQNNNILYNYLCDTRKIDRDVIDFFTSKGNLYQSNNNVVFLGTDKYNNTKDAGVKLTNQNKSFSWIVESSDTNYKFNHIGKNNKIFVFEAPIDMLSYISIHKTNWQENSYISLSGVSSKPIIQALKDYPFINNVVLCLDNDDAGIKATKRIERNIIREIADKNYDIDSKTSINKDWNEDLKTFKNKTEEQIHHIGKNYKFDLENKSTAKYKFEELLYGFVISDGRKFLFEISEEISKHLNLAELTNNMMFKKYPENPVEEIEKILKKSNDNEIDIFSKDTLTNIYSQIFVMDYVIDMDLNNRQCLEQDLELK